MIKPAVAPAIIRRKLDSAATNEMVNLAGRGIFPLSVPAAANLRVRFGETSAEPFALASVSAIQWCDSEFRQLYLTWDAVPGGEIELMVLDGDVQLCPSTSWGAAPVHVLAQGSTVATAFNTVVVVGAIPLPNRNGGWRIHAAVSAKDTAAGMNLWISTLNGTSVDNDIIRVHRVQPAERTPAGAPVAAGAEPSWHVAAIDATYVAFGAIDCHEPYIVVAFKHLNSGGARNLKYRITAVPLGT